MPNEHSVLAVREPVRIVRPEMGPPILYVLLYDIEQVVKIGRHYKDGRTSPCECDPPCGSYRLDYFMRALVVSRVLASEPCTLQLEGGQLFCNFDLGVNEAEALCNGEGTFVVCTFTGTIGGGGPCDGATFTATLTVT